MKEFSFLIVAGGSGSRIGGLEKQFRSLEGKPLWRWSADLAESLRDAGVREIVLVLPQTGQADENFFQTLPSCGTPVKIVFGGATRPDSVQNGLAACTCEFVMVHDAARPFASRRLLLNLMENTTPVAGAVPVMPLAEAIKRIGPKKTSQRVEAVDRDGLYATQTPQSFHRNTLARVLKEHGASVKDEAEAWLAANLELRCIDGERLNFKVTWPEDLQLAEAFTFMRGEPTVRTGMGYDVHRLVPERPLILGGCLIGESPLGLYGHSDADVLAHTVADALLGAAGLPDIGNLFPADDERYKNADSMELLRQVVEKVKRELWEIVWVDAVVEAQVPRLNQYLPAIKEKVSAILNPQGAICVNLKAKSAEKTGDVGAGRSMACWAVATLKRRGAAA